MNVRAETTSELFADLNELRRINDKAPLKSWKDSKAKLLAAIASEEAEGLAPAPVKVKVDPSYDAKVFSQIEENKKLDIIDRIDLVGKAIEENKKANAKIVDHSASNKLIADALARDPELRAKVVVSDADKAKVKKMNNKKAVKAAARAKTQPVVKTEGAVNVSAICKELKLNPKVARATLRRMKVDRTDEKAVRAALTKKK